MKAEDLDLYNEFVGSHAPLRQYSKVVFEEDLKMLLEAYADSQLQALKEEVEELDHHAYRDSKGNWYDIVSRKEVLNLITNIEDK